MVSIFKKGQCLDPSCYHPISLLFCLSKLYSSHMLHALISLNRVIFWARTDRIWGVVQPWTIVSICLPAARPDNGQQGHTKSWKVWTKKAPAFSGYFLGRCGHGLVHPNQDGGQSRMSLYLPIHAADLWMAGIVCGAEAGNLGSQPL